MYITLINGTPQPYSITQLRRDNPNTSFPAVMSDEVLARNGLYRVASSPLPSYDKRTHYHKEAGVSQSDGKWVMGYTVEALPRAQVEQTVKAERDQMLAATDWRVVVAYESQTEVPQEWIKYRQKLRDLTTQPGFPYDIVWPVKPQL